jgi:hypothetical protein
MHFVVALLVPLLLGLGACSDAPTYPPDFRYFEKGEIEGVMHRLAVELTALDDIMWKETRTAEDQEEIVEILARMRSLTRELTRVKQSNHPRIDRVAPVLQSDLERALRDARRDPPDYYFAGEVAGTCNYCHVPRHGPLRGDPLRRPTGNLD